jgi:hypothetical protein
VGPVLVPALAGTSGADHSETMTRLHVLSTWALAALLPFSPGCGHGHDESDADAHAHEHGDHEHGDHDHGDHEHGDHTHSHEDGGHVHVAPHGGELVAIAEEFFNAELLLNSETGDLRLYLLDAHAENPVRVDQAAIELTVQLDSVSHELSLAAVADALTEETVGDTSQFAVQSSALVGVTAFEGTLGRIEGRGEVFESTSFSFPAGHDHGHDHEHEHGEASHSHEHTHGDETHTHEHEHGEGDHDHDHADHDHADHDHDHGDHGHDHDHDDHDA